MKNNNIIRFVQSLVLIPVFGASLPFGGLQSLPMPAKDVNMNYVQEAHVYLAINPAEKPDSPEQQKEDLEAATLQAQAEAIDAYFRKYDMPLEGQGLNFATEALKNGLDYRLVAAISVIESTGGRNACKKVPHSFLGWGSCKISFKSDEEAIRIVSWNLGGKNPNTDQHYSGKTNKQILEKYNPPSVVPNYAAKVMKVMASIGLENITITADNII